ncbi:MAG: cobalamin-binding protein [Anaerolineae bacterium]|jgi:methanogenic corrinoid protein MtbC1|nr:MAG: cobalamin-binding protein [Anaerolineae bacterium]
MTRIMTIPELRTALIQNIADLNEAASLSLVQALIENQTEPLEIVQDCQEGMRQVGERYERGEYFLSALIMAGEIFREVMEMVTPLIKERFRGNESGVILLGTVEGDIHDIGKNNLSLLLTSYGFTVHDLGVDVPPSEFLRQAQALHPDIIGLSGLLTSSYDSMKRTVQLLRNAEDARVVKTPVIIGGNQLNEQVCQYAGADAWVNDAMSGVRWCQRLLGHRS